MKRKWRKCENQFNRDLEELKNKHAETAQLLKLKVLEKESIAEYLKQKNESMSWKIKWWK